MILYRASDGVHFTFTAPQHYAHAPDPDAGRVAPRRALRSRVARQSRARHAPHVLTQWVSGTITDSAH
jgi:hypothetical protein